VIVTAVSPEHCVKRPMFRVVCWSPCLAVGKLHLYPSTAPFAAHCNHEPGRAGPPGQPFARQPTQRLRPFLGRILHKEAGSGKDDNAHLCRSSLGEEDLIGPGLPQARQSFGGNATFHGSPLAILAGPTFPLSTFPSPAPLSPVRNLCPSTSDLGPFVPLSRGPVIPVVLFVFSYAPATRHAKQFKLRHLRGRA
jgi:hypothetical protein